MTRFVFALLLAGSASAQTWVELDPSGTAPTPRANAAAIYDPLGHRLIVFGGLISGGDLNDVWALDLEANAWTELTPSSGPAPRTRWSHNAVYDSGNHQMLVWSGRHRGDFFNDVWAFDLNEHVWREFAADPQPNLRYGTAAVFDPVAGQLVNFAGFTNAGRFDDTWAFDPVTSTWADLSNDTRPSARCLHTASYDPLGHRMLVFGGQSGGSALGDLWALDLATRAWSELTPTAGPEGRTFPTSVYDPVGHRFVVFGGAEAGGGGQKRDEVWAFDLAANTWSQLQPSGPVPAARGGAAGAYITGHNRALFFGGSATVGLFNDVWALEDLAVEQTMIKGAGWGQVKNGAP